MGRTASYRHIRFNFGPDWSEVGVQGPRFRGDRNNVQHAAQFDRGVGDPQFQGARCAFKVDFNTCDVR